MIQSFIKPQEINTPSKTPHYHFGGLAKVAVCEINHYHWLLCLANSK